MSSSSRPAKRPRRSTITVSDDEDEDEIVQSTKLRARNKNTSISLRNPKNAFNSKSTSTTTKKATSIKRTVKPGSTQSSPLSSPSKLKKSQKLLLDDTKNKSLHSFFSKVADEERWQRRSFTPEVESQSTVVEDEIVDDSLDLTTTTLGFSMSSDVKPLAAAIHRSSISSTSQSNSVNSSQKFKKPATVKKPTLVSEPKTVILENPRQHGPWAERYAPTSLEELAIHKKKILDVQKWLDDSLSGRSPQRLLVLKGPAGSGKSTCINMIAQTRKLDLVQWQNATTSEVGALSNSLQFAEFVSRGGEYGALSFGGSAVGSAIKSNGTRVLVVEDFPTSMTRSSTALESFRTVLLQYLTESGQSAVFGITASLATYPPIVLIISETLMSSSMALTDSFTAHRLLGPELSNHALATVIEFNPVAPTFITKALDHVIKKEARDSGRRRIPGPALLARLAEIGDIRNAVNSLELLCARGDEVAGWSGTVAASSKRTNRSQPPSELEESSMKLINSRESTLDMFHAAGKVVYNKREDPGLLDTRALPPPKPPDHLVHLYNPKSSLVDVEALLNETGTDIQTFVSTVHENYVLSCNHDNFTGYFDHCASYLSDAELLDPDSRPSLRSKGRATASLHGSQPGAYDALRQDELSFQVATRGILFSLPYPVSRAAPDGARKQDAFKMFYPTSLRLWKPMEEVRELISVVSRELSNLDTADSTVTRHGDGVLAWTSRNGPFHVSPSFGENTQDGVSRIVVNQDNLVLDVLPYLTRIRASQCEDVSQLRKITSMNGTTIRTEGSFGDDLPPTEKISGTVRLSQRIDAAQALLQQSQIIKSKGKLPDKKASSKTDQSAVTMLEIEDDAIEDSE